MYVRRLIAVALALFALNTIAAPDEDVLGKGSGYPFQRLHAQPSSKIVVVITSASRAPETTNDVFVERNYFVGSVLKALGGQADVYR